MNTVRFAPTITMSSQRHHLWRMVTVVSVVLLGLLLAACGGAAPTDNAAADAASEAPVYQPPTSGTAIEPPRELLSFTLPNQDGEMTSIEDFRGKPTLLYFGYTYCPDVCPTTLADLVSVKRDLEEAGYGDAAHFVMVSVDPERDTPAVLNRYMQNFHEDFVGLSGDADTLRRIGSDYGLYVQKREVAGTSADYLIDHSAATYLVDEEGRLTTIYGYGINPDIIAEDLITYFESEQASS